MPNSLDPAIRVLYIGGYVRSGTTIVDMLLGMNTATIAVGEINLIFRQVAKTDPPVLCSCGEPLSDCPLWTNVLDRFRAALPDISFERADDITRMVETFPERLRDASRYRDEYAKIWRVMFEAIAEVSGAQYIVDSSKTGRHSLYRPASLVDAGFDVSLLQMVRDPRAVTWSKLRREISRGRLQRRSALFAAAFMSGLHWSVTNVSTDLLYCGGKKLPYYRMRYLDFVEQPVEKLREIEQTFQIDLSRTIEVIQRDETIGSGHLASGNELRLQNDLRLRKQPPNWKTALPHPARLGVMVSLPVARCLRLPHHRLPLSRGTTCRARFSVSNG
ncbi:MAG: hypothetical protein U0703_26730 [Anaerolineae bacterium]